MTYREGKAIEAAFWAAVLVGIIIAGLVRRALRRRRHGRIVRDR